MNRNLDFLHPTSFRLHPWIIFDRVGLEPTLPRLKGECLNHLGHRSLRVFAFFLDPAPYPGVPLSRCPRVFLHPSSLQSGGANAGRVRHRRGSINQALCKPERQELS
jgi:hypothetical protein